MAQANDSILVTPGSGATVATEMINSKEHQVIVRADAYGHIIGARDTFVFSAAAMAKSASKNYMTLWNGDGALFAELVYAQVNQELTVAVTGLVRGVRLHRITAAPSAGTTLTAVKLRTAGTALDADIVGRKDGVTATAVGDPVGIAGVGEEETGAAGAAPHILYSELLYGEPLILAPSEGCVILQDSTAGTGLLSALMVFRQRA